MGATPIRRCVACRRPHPKSSLLRLALTGNVVVPDREARRPGRGAYLCDRRECLDAALRREGAVLARALRRRPVTVDADTMRDAWQDAFVTSPLGGRSGRRPGAASSQQQVHEDAAARRERNIAATGR